jgi:hypothetical protein
MAQGVGYVLAAAGPLALGAIHDATGSWTAPIITLLVMLVPLALAGIGAARNRHVGVATEPVPSPAGNGTSLSSGERSAPSTPEADPPPAASNGASLSPDERAAPTAHGAPAVRPTLRGVVRTAGGTSLAGATVTLVDDDGRQLGATRTDGTGGYELPVPPIACLLVCAAPEHAPQARRAAPGRVDVALEPRAVGALRAREH